MPQRIAPSETGRATSDANVQKPVQNSNTPHIPLRSLTDGAYLVRNDGVSVLAINTAAAPKAILSAAIARAKGVQTVASIFSALPLNAIDVIPADLISDVFVSMMEWQSEVTQLLEFATSEVEKAERNEGGAL